MYAPTANATASGRRRAHPQITESRPNVATASLTIWGNPLLGVLRPRVHGLAKHGVRERHAGERSHDLRDDISAQIVAGFLTGLNALTGAVLNVGRGEIIFMWCVFFVAGTLQWFAVCRSCTGVCHGVAE